MIQAVLPDRDAPGLLTAVAAVVARRHAYRPRQPGPAAGAAAPQTSG
ncbi:hypothetical protein [Actinomycetospora corticicola]|uniref:Uncharacterized protein n=1 Tax=Actinomycetospora corticicola TaxID=663602 RepID=A0A7Y9DX75_9PSEU|nr:hypothetical protein [Actinomycetospora corticicola]NYD37174.1 hypothetical protein [Actinomycetospora corticicola]